jgi:hypothetical protein
MSGISSSGQVIQFSCVRCHSRNTQYHLTPFTIDIEDQRKNGWKITDGEVKISGGRLVFSLWANPNAASITRCRWEFFCKDCEFEWDQIS